MPNDAIGEVFIRTRSFLYLSASACKSLWKAASVPAFWQFWPCASQTCPEITEEVAVGIPRKATPNSTGKERRPPFRGIMLPQPVVTVKAEDFFMLKSA